MTDHGQQHDQGDYDVWGADFGKVGIDGVTDNRLRPGPRTPAPRGQGETVRAAQVKAAGAPQDAPDGHGVDHTTNPGRTAGSVAGQPLTRGAHDDADRHRAQDAVMVEALTAVRRLLGYLPDGIQRAIIIAASRVEDLSHAHGLADGYAAAVAELRGVVQRTGSPAAQWAADYLEAVGAGTDSETPEVVHLCPTWEEAVFTPCCGKTPFELPRLDRLTTDPAQATYQGPEVGAGADETVRARGGIVQGGTWAIVGETGPEAICDRFPGCRCSSGCAREAAQ